MNSRHILISFFIQKILFLKLNAIYYNYLYSTSILKILENENVYLKKCKWQWSNIYKHDEYTPQYTKFCHFFMSITGNRLILLYELFIYLLRTYNNVSIFTFNGIVSMANQTSIVEDEKNRFPKFRCHQNRLLPCDVSSSSQSS